MGFLFALKQFVMLPVTLVMGIWHFLRDIVANPQGGRLALLAFPAVLIGFIAITVVIVSLWGREERVIKQYTVEYEAARDEAEKLFRESIFAKIQENARAGKKPLVADLDQQDPDVAKFVSLRRQIQNNLEKLIQIRPDSKKYRYDYAISFTSLDQQKAGDLLRELAPNDAPGYAPAHATLARLSADTFAAAVNNAKPEQKQQYMASAFVHANHCLALDPTNLDCRAIRAEIYFIRKNYGEALADYQELIKKDSVFARYVLDCQKALGMKAEYDATLAETEIRVANSDIVNNRSSIREWQKYLVLYIDLTTLNLNFKDPESVLERERAEAGTDVSKNTVLNSVETILLTRWAKFLFGNKRDETQVEQVRPATREEKELALQKLEKAYGLDPKIELALALLTQIGFEKNDLGERARAIYDPVKDDNAPGSVYAYVGSNMFQEGNYTSAVEMFEKARRSRPNDPEILNNLAYGYLTTNVDTPDKALGLVEKAIKLATDQGRANDKPYIATLYHTKGSALLRLNRLDEAAVAFELALEGRPDNEEILTKIVDCYKATNPKQAEIYQRKLDLLLQRKKTENGNS